MCRLPGYSSSKDPIRRQQTVEALCENLKATFMYRYAEEFSSVSHYCMCVYMYMLILVATV